MARGVNGQDIFVDDHDRRLFLETISLTAEICSAKVVAYCLMGNHFHLVIKVGEVSLSTFMRRALTVYSKRFNLRHGREGHLFQARYLAKLCTDDSYLTTMIRYVHWNPVKAGLVERPRMWPWSSALRFDDNDAAPCDFDPWRDNGCASVLLRPERTAVSSLEAMTAKISAAAGIQQETLRSKSAVRQVVEARRRLVKEAVGQGHPPKDVAEWLGVSVMSVSRYSRRNC